MKIKYKTTSYRLLSALFLIILIGAAVGASLMPLNKQQGKNKIEKSLVDTVCNLNNLWRLTLGHTNRAKYYPIDETGEVTFWGKVTYKTSYAGVDHLGEEKVDYDSTFNIDVDQTKLPIHIQDYIAKAKGMGHIVQSTDVHCEIVYTHSPGNLGVYGDCNCKHPDLPPADYYVKVTGKLVLDLYHVDAVGFHNFELHPVTYIWNSRLKRKIN